MADQKTDVTVEAYQERRRAFKPLWHSNFLQFALPGFLLFILGNPYMFDAQILMLFGFPLFAFGMLRGVLLLHRHLRCPICNKLQSPEKRFPNRVCPGCGAALSYGPEDS